MLKGIGLKGPATRKPRNKISSLAAFNTAISDRLFFFPRLGLLKGIGLKGPATRKPRNKMLSLI